ncbi:hypothetical protein WME95_21850 [Sorangium sp. So ce327]|uniref:hypothetical protein n=1 Tax=Sorangium sp. So ce327 TaxID=3133301 RepID=UPI003F5F0AF6
MLFRARYANALLLTLLLPCFVACGDDTSDATSSGATSGGTGGAGGAGGEGTGAGGATSGTGGTPNVGPAYALTVQVFGPDGGDTQSYVIVTDDIDSEETLSLDDAIEVQGRALGVGLDGGGAVFVASDAAATVTRYDLQEDGSLEEGDTVSFQGKGLAKLGEYGTQFHFVSETKAYFFDGPTAQVVVWNPHEMTVTGDIPLEDLVIPDATLTYSSSSPLVQGDDVITFGGWRIGAEVPSVAAVVVVDSATDEATVVTDERCGYVRDGVEGPDGMIYVATEAYGAAVHRLNAENAAAPCMLRFDPETRQFDPEFHVELSTLFDGDAAGSLFGGPDGKAFLRVLDESLFAIADDTHPRVLASAAAWRWASVTLGDTPTATVLDAAPGGGSVLSVALGDRTFLLEFEGQESTTLREIGEDGPGEAGVSAPGLTFSVAKIR